MNMRFILAHRTPNKHQTGIWKAWGRREALQGHGGVRSDLEAELGPGKVFVWWGCGQVSKYGQTQRPDNMQKVPS